MEKEKKISKGLVAGCLMMVVALTIWVININDTYSTDSSTTPKCKSLNGIEYKYVSNATNDQYGCCPVSDTAKIGSLGGGNKCFSNTVNGSCPTGYTLMRDSSGNCIADLGQVLVIIAMVLRLLVQVIYGVQVFQVNLVMVEVGKLKVT